MHVPSSPVLGLFTILFANLVSATALTYKLHPNEKECFFAHIDKVDRKIGFYFAVQSGGSFDSESKVCSLSR